MERGIGPVQGNTRSVERRRQAAERSPRQRRIVAAPAAKMPSQGRQRLLLVRRQRRAAVEAGNIEERRRRAHAWPAGSAPASMATRQSWICAMPRASLSASSRPERWMYCSVVAGWRWPAKVAMACSSQPGAGEVGQAEVAQRVRAEARHAGGERDPAHDLGPGPERQRLRPGCAALRQEQRPARPADPGPVREVGAQQLAADGRIGRHALAPALCGLGADAQQPVCRGRSRRCAGCTAPRVAAPRRSPARAWYGCGSAPAGPSPGSRANPPRPGSRAAVLGAAPTPAGCCRRHGRPARSGRGRPGWCPAGPPRPGGRRTGGRP